jgi:hypothetical protein
MAMTVRRDNISGKRTPDGVLTRVSETARGRIVKKIEVRADPRTIDLGFFAPYSERGCLPQDKRGHRRDREQGGREKP